MTVVDRKDKPPHVAALSCPQCSSPMKLRTSTKYFYNDGTYRLFYSCSRFPDCRNTAGAKPDGSPEGRPADRATREARIRAHGIFDRLWKGPNADMSREHAYRLLRDLTGMRTDESHFSKFSISQCEKIVEILIPYLPPIEGDESE